ncbi:MAG: phosphonate ABC transporter ATP-binding protein [Lactobacillaceae bacterium]|jgi:phosphonate transport system ATP-binding protein|nr:phosphonate ABC transporter ATP-binding protein [Lactobacillaceae bacterium]
MADSIIEINDVSKVYDNGVVGLQNVSLNVKKGEFLVIVGLSGAGKSTLLRALNRLNEITSGEIIIDGESITKAKGKKLREIRRSVAMIFQNFNLVKRSSVRRNVLSGRVGYYDSFRSTFGMWSKADKERSAEVLRRVNLLEKYYDRADALSGGQQQRVAIARALMQEPKIMLADEPTASLDPATSQVVMDDLQILNNDGITIVANLHSEALALQYATRIIGLAEGKLIFDKPVEQVTEADFDSVYGRTPKSVDTTKTSEQPTAGKTVEQAIELATEKNDEDAEVSVL